MAIEVVTDFRVLMQLAGAVGAAKKAGDAVALEKAEKEHDVYKELCLNSDRMSLGTTYGELAKPRAPGKDF